VKVTEKTEFKVRSVVTDHGERMVRTTTILAESELVIFEVKEIINYSDESPALTYERHMDLAADAIMRLR
jgi:hypothetical protein